MSGHIYAEIHDNDVTGDPQPPPSGYINQQSVVHHGEINTGYLEMTGPAAAAAGHDDGYGYLETVALERKMDDMYLTQTPMPCQPPPYKHQPPAKGTTSVCPQKRHVRYLIIGVVAMMLVTGMVVGAYFLGTSTGKSEHLIQ